MSGNRYLEAFKENSNVIGLAAAVALSAAMLNPLPLLVGLVAEAVYLLFVPDSRWYDARLSQRYDAEVERRRQQLKAQVLPTLHPEMQARFIRLEETRHQINAQATTEQTWFREVLRKLDYLLEKFLLFASKEMQFRSHLRAVLEEVRGGKPRAEKKDEARPQSVSSDDRQQHRTTTNAPRQQPARQQPAPRRADDAPPDAADRWVQQTVGEAQANYELEMNDIKKLLEKEQDVDTKAVLEKRLDVLQRRHEFVGKIGKTLLNLNHQLELLEDTFGLISDEMRARSPEQILADIEDVVGQTDTMTRVLEEVAPYEQMAARMERTRA